MQSQYAQRDSPSSRHPPSNYAPSEIAQQTSGGSATSITSSLRQWRKKDYVEKQQISLENAPPPSGASNSTENSSHIARVAPHAYYPSRTAHSGGGGDGDLYHYQHPYADYNGSSQYKPPTAGPVKYSEVAENIHPQTLEQIKNSKEKDYVDLCGGSPQSHMKQYQEHNALKTPYPENIKQQYADPTAMHHQFISKEPQIHPFIQKQPQMHPQYVQKEQFQQYMPKYNIQPQYPQGYPSVPNNFLENLSKINPRMADSILNDAHLRETQMSMYHNMDQPRSCQQPQRIYHGSSLYSNQPHSHRNISQPFNYSQTYNYNVKAGMQPSDPYGRMHQYQDPVSKYIPDYKLGMEQPPMANIPPRRVYPEGMHMNFPPIASKVSPNFSSHCAQLEYAQHYQHRRSQMSQEYYGHAPSAYKAAFVQSSQMSPDNAIPVESRTTRKSSLKQFLENWVEEDMSGNLPDIIVSNNISEIENLENLKGTICIKSANTTGNQDQQQQLFVLDTTEITNENLPHLLHLEKYEKLPDNIRGYYHSTNVITSGGRRIIIENRPSTTTTAAATSESQSVISQVPHEATNLTSNPPSTVKNDAIAHNLENKVVQIHIIENDETATTNGALSSNVATVSAFESPPGAVIVQSSSVITTAADQEADHPKNMPVIDEITAEKQPDKEKANIKKVEECNSEVISKNVDEDEVKPLNKNEENYSDKQVDNVLPKENDKEMSLCNIVEQIEDEVPSNEVNFEDPKGISETDHTESDNSNKDDIISVLAQASADSEKRQAEDYTKEKCSSLTETRESCVDIRDNVRVSEIDNLQEENTTIEDPPVCNNELDLCEIDKNKEMEHKQPPEKNVIYEGSSKSETEDSTLNNDEISTPFCEEAETESLSEQEQYKNNDEFYDVRTPAPLNLSLDKRLQENDTSVIPLIETRNEILESISKSECVEKDAEEEKIIEIDKPAEICRSEESKKNPSLKITIKNLSVIKYIPNESDIEHNGTRKSSFKAKNKKKRHKSLKKRTHDTERRGSKDAHHKYDGLKQHLKEHNDQTNKIMGSPCIEDKQHKHLPSTKNIIENSTTLESSEFIQQQEYDDSVAPVIPTEERILEVEKEDDYCIPELLNSDNQIASQECITEEVITEHQKSSTTVHVHGETKEHQKSSINVSVDGETKAYQKSSTNLQNDGETTELQKSCTNLSVDEEYSLSENETLEDTSCPVVYEEQEEEEEDVVIEKEEALAEQLDDPVEEDMIEINKLSTKDKQDEVDNNEKQVMGENNDLDCSDSKVVEETCQENQNVVYQIDDPNVILQIGDELLEINVSVQNGRKLILVKTFSDAVVLNHSVQEELKDKEISEEVEEKSQNVVIQEELTEKEKCSKLEEMLALSEQSVNDKDETSDIDEQNEFREISYTIDKVEEAECFEKFSKINQSEKFEEYTTNVESLDKSVKNAKELKEDIEIITPIETSVDAIQEMTLVETNFNINHLEVVAEEKIVTLETETSCEGVEVFHTNLDDELCICNEEIVSSSTEIDVTLEMPQLEQQVELNELNIVSNEKSYDDDTLPPVLKTKGALKFLETNPTNIASEVPNKKNENSITKPSKNEKVHKTNNGQLIMKSFKNDNNKSSKGSFKDQNKNVIKNKTDKIKKTAEIVQEPTKRKLKNTELKTKRVTFDLDIKKRSVLKPPRKLKLPKNKNKNLEVKKDAPPKLEEFSNTLQVSVQENSITSSTCQLENESNRITVSVPRQFSEDWENDWEESKLAESIASSKRRLSLQEYNKRKNVEQEKIIEPVIIPRNDYRDVDYRHPNSPESPTLNVNFSNKTYSRSISCGSIIKNCSSEESSLSSAIELQLPKIRRNSLKHEQPIKSPVEVFSQEYLKNALINDLRSVNAYTVSLIKKNENLMARFLAQQKLTDEELKEIRKIIRYKRLVHHLSTIRINELEDTFHSKCHDKPYRTNSYRNIDPFEFNLNSRSTTFDSPPSPTRSSNKATATDNRNRKRKRFRNLHSDDESTSNFTLPNETISTEIQSKLPPSHIEKSDDYVITSKRSKLEDQNYSVYQSDSQRQLKLVFKRSCRNDPKMQPFVKIERLSSIDMLARNNCCLNLRDQIL